MSDSGGARLRSQAGDLVFGTCDCLLPGLGQQIGHYLVHLRIGALTAFLVPGSVTPELARSWFGAGGRLQFDEPRQAPMQFVFEGLEVLAGHVLRRTTLHP